MGNSGTLGFSSTTSGFSALMRFLGDGDDLAATLSESRLEVFFADDDEAAGSAFFFTELTLFLVLDVFSRTFVDVSMTSTGSVSGTSSFTSSASFFFRSGDSISDVVVEIVDFKTTTPSLFQGKIVGTESDFRIIFPE